MGIGKVFLFSMGKGMGHSPAPLIVLGGWMNCESAACFVFNSRTIVQNFPDFFFFFSSCRAFLFRGWERRKEEKQFSTNAPESYTNLFVSM